MHLFFQVENLRGKNQTRGRGILTKTLIFVSGIVGILLLPSAVFYYNERGWTYLDCVYFSLVSLATGGLGNLTNSHNSNEAQVSGNWRCFYQALTLLWFILGLGFISMVNSLAMETIRRASMKQENRGRMMHPTIKGQEMGGQEGVSWYDEWISTITKIVMSVDIHLSNQDPPYRESAITLRPPRSDSEVLIFESEIVSITRPQTQHRRLCTQKSLP